MVDKTTADWQDVNKLAMLLAKGETRETIRIEAAQLSHIKYTYGNHSEKGHELRKKYRTWLIDNAYKEYKKVMKLCQALG